MQCIRKIRVLFVIVLAGMFSCHGLRAQTAVINSNTPTFDYDTRTYAEVTNSIQQVQQRLEVAEKTLGNDNTNVADLLSDLAGFYDDSGDFAQAASLDQRCLAIREKLLGP